MGRQQRTEGYEWRKKENHNVQRKAGKVTAGQPLLSWLEIHFSNNNIQIKAGCLKEFIHFLKIFGEIITFDGS